MRRLQKLYHIAKQAGLIAAGDYARIKLSGAASSIRPRDVLHPLLARARSSDLDLFIQIFVEREYDCLNLFDGELIVDLGANVGYSSAYFLSHYPNSPVIAVEPDPENFALLQKNLWPFGSRAVAIEAAIWSHNTKVSIRSEKYRDGASWARQVEENKNGNIDAIDISSLFALSKRDRIGLLKVDIEGAEAVIFDRKYSWLDQIDRIAIELHDDTVFGCTTDKFFGVIDQSVFDISKSGELTICCRKSLGIR